jgi:tetratricopeptide (TPR) repeat protein
VNPCFVMGELAALRGDARLADMAGKRALTLLGKVFDPATPRYQKGQVRLGGILLGIGRIDEADALFTEVMTRDAAHASVYDSAWTMASVAHARAQLARGQQAAAVAALDAALSKFLAQPPVVHDLNEETDIRFALGQALAGADRAAQALPHLQRALTLRQTQYVSSPRLAEAQLALADCQLRLGNADGARALLAQARKIHAANTELAAVYREPLRNLERRLASS